MWPHANIGIDLARSGLVDVAPDSVEWQAQFIAWGLPQTLCFASGGGEGHTHHLYARPENCAVYRACESGQYDVLSNGYAVMPPSLHRSQRRYAWTFPRGGPISTTDTPAPKWVLDMLSARSQRAAAPPHSEHDADAPPIELSGDARERWYGRLFERKANGSVDRSYSLWWLAVVLLEAGLSRLFVEDLIAQRDMALGWEKFTNRRDANARYRIIVDRAVAGRGPGRASGKQQKQKQPRTPPEDDYVWYTGATLEELEEEELTWFIFKYLACGVITELDGKVKQAGKTTLIAYMLRCILDGQPFLGEPTTYTTVTYLTEQSTQTFKRNLRRGGLNGRPDLHILPWVNTKSDTWPVMLAKVRLHMQANASRLLVVDTLGQFSGVKGDEENKAGAALKVMEPLLELAAAGFAVLISRHDRKSGGDVGDSGRGSSAITGAGDVILHLQRVATDDPSKKRQRKLEALTRLDEIGDLIIELEADEPYTYRLVGDQEHVRSRDMRIEILAALPTTPDEAIDREALFDRIGGRALDITRALRDLINEHEVVRLGKGIAGDRYRYYQRVWDDGDDD